MSFTVSSGDPRFGVLTRSRNLRWPVREKDRVSRVEVCQSTADIAEALEKIVAAGLRPTVRSGGHCYEDFVVNNPGGAILDLSLHTAGTAPGGDGRYYVAAGRALGDNYIDLYKKYGLTIPAGTCYSVGAGGAYQRGRLRVARAVAWADGRLGIGRRYSDGGRAGEGDAAAGGCGA